MGRATPSLTLLTSKKGKNEKKGAPKLVGPKGFAAADAVGFSQKSAPKKHLLSKSL